MLLGSSHGSDLRVHGLADYGMDEGEPVIRGDDELRRRQHVRGLGGVFRVELREAGHEAQGHAVAEDRDRLGEPPCVRPEPVDADDHVARDRGDAVLARAPHARGAGAARDRLGSEQLVDVERVSTGGLGTGTAELVLRVGDPRADQLGHPLLAQVGGTHRVDEPVVAEHRQEPLVDRQVAGSKREEDRDRDPVRPTGEEVE
jgi:hypothetical protein